MKETLLKGVIDIHVHSGPDDRPRKFHDIELAENVKNAGGRAVLLKSHVVPTMDRAYIARVVTGFDVFGSIVLNYAVGGFNPYAVENALLMGAKTVWMPTMDAANHMHWLGKRGGLVAAKGGKLHKSLDDILRLIAEHDAILSTGHLGMEEQFILIERAKELNVKKVVVDHPEQGMVNMPVPKQQELVEKFGAYIQRCASIESWVRAYKTNADSIKEIGAESTVIVTDCGVPQLPFWDELMMEYLTAMLDMGITTDMLDVMTKTNPAYLLGL